MSEMNAVAHGLAVVDEAVITQDDLAKFKKMAETAKTYASKVRAEREKLMARREAGARIERGRFDFRQKAESGNRSWAQLLPKFLKTVVLRETGELVTYKDLLAQTKPEDKLMWRIVDTENQDAVV